MKKRLRIASLPLLAVALCSCFNYGSNRDPSGNSRKVDLDSQVEFITKGAVSKTLNDMGVRLSKFETAIIARPTKDEVMARLDVPNVHVAVYDNNNGSYELKPLPQAPEYLEDISLSLDYIYSEYDDRDFQLWEVHWDHNGKPAVSVALYSSSLDRIVYDNILSNIIVAIDLTPKLSVPMTKSPTETLEHKTGIVWEKDIDMSFSNGLWSYMGHLSGRMEVTGKFMEDGRGNRAVNIESSHCTEEFRSESGWTTSSQLGIYNLKTGTDGSFDWGWAVGFVKGGGSVQIGVSAGGFSIVLSPSSFGGETRKYSEYQSDVTA